MYEALIEAFDAAERDPDIGAFVLSGKGGVFTAGNDIGDFLAVAMARESGRLSRPGGSPASSPSSKSRWSPRSTGSRSASGRRSAFIAISSTPTPDARFQMPFVNLGLVPEAGSSLLAPQRFGRAKAAEFLLLAEPFDAEQAHALGLVNALVPQAELIAHAMAKAAALAAKPRAALLATRRLMRGDAEALKARMAEEMHAFSAALKPARGACGLPGVPVGRAEVAGLEHPAHRDVGPDQTSAT